jgi:hypothetical protein
MWAAGVVDQLLLRPAGQLMISPNPLNPDTDGDGYWDYVEYKFSTGITPSANPLIFQQTAKIYDSNHNLIKIIYPYDASRLIVIKGYQSLYLEKMKPHRDIPPWAPIADEFAPHLFYEQSNQEFPTSIFYDNDKDLTNNGVPAIYPPTKSAPTGERKDVINKGYTNIGEKYYSADYAKSQGYDNLDAFQYTSTATYLQAYQKENLIGIQYWFYYVFHDDPGGDIRQNDWWYFWIVYDTKSFKPVQAVYDFHHNLRTFDWSSGYIKKNGFHPKVWLDAGGHRSLYSPGEDVDLGVSAQVLAKYVVQQPNLSERDKYLYGMSYDGKLRDILYYDIASYYPKGNVEIDPHKYDVLFGVMLDGYELERAANSKKKGTAPWRIDIIGLGSDEVPPVLQIGMPGVGNIYGGYTESGVSWNVESFPYKIYIYSNKPEHISGNWIVGYVGANMYYSQDKNEWPFLENNIAGYPWADKPPTSDEYGSTTYLVWSWDVHGKYFSNTVNPDATTQFVDGSTWDGKTVSGFK